MRENPCPATAQHRGACPGWEVDHVQALVCGGRDHRSNMQWLTVAARESQPPYVLGNYPRAEIEFMCLGAADPELRRPRMEPAPNVIIQTR